MVEGIGGGETALQRDELAPRASLKGDKE